jgi:hypothetical protein
MTVTADDRPTPSCPFSFHLIRPLGHHSCARLSDMLLPPPPLSSSLTQGIVFPEGPALLASVVLKSRASSPLRFVFIRWSFYCTVLIWNKHKHPKWDKCFLSIKNESNFKWYQRSMVQFIRGTNARFKFVIFNIKFQSNTLFLSPKELMFSFIFFLASLYHRLQI